MRLPLASAVCVHGSALSACLQFPWRKNDIMICHYEPAVVSTSLNVDTVMTFLDLLYSSPVAAVESIYFSAVLQSNPGFHWDLSNLATASALRIPMPSWSRPRCSWRRPSSITGASNGALMPTLNCGTYSRKPRQISQAAKADCWLRQSGLTCAP